MTSTEDPTMADPRDIKTLIAIMQALRTPVTGCPWDLEQNFATIAPYTIEEAYEVADAIERNDMKDLCEELGDLQLQVVYHAQLAQELDAFDLGDVMAAVNAKMIRRHPHVFGDQAARDAGAVKGMWEALKAGERAAKGHGAGEVTGLLDDIPVALPGLARAVKLQARAASVGFDWPSLGPVLDKAEEEIGELREAVSQGTDQDHMAEELGDLLFVLANVARHLKIDPDDALRRANRKFNRRFAYIENVLRENREPLAEAGLERMDALWDEAKSRGL
jgi:ATP diphosphatase